jgi:hypothetical protein
MKLCGSVECAKANNAERAKRARDKQKNPDPEPVASISAAKQIQSSWGVPYNSRQEMMADLLITGGYVSDVDSATQAKWRDLARKAGLL